MVAGLQGRSSVTIGFLQLDRAREGTERKTSVIKL
jgi:hypothetical protein